VAKLARAGALNWCKDNPGLENHSKWGTPLGNSFSGPKGAWPGGPITTIPVAPTTDVRSKTS